MKRGLLLALLLFPLLTAVARAGDWRETLSAPRPGGFPAPRPQRAVYRFGWSGVTAAQATFDFSKPARGQLQLTMSTRTIGLARALWRMDTQHSALCREATLRPISLQQTEIYANETESTRANFFPDAVVRQTRVTPLKGPQEKEKRFKFPDVFDLQTALLFIRSQRLRTGESHRLMVYPSTAAYFAEVEVLGREKLKVAAGRFDAIKCAVRLQRVSKKIELTPHRKFKRAYAWLSDDGDRLLLKIEAEIFVGSVWGELQSVEFDPKP